MLKPDFTATFSRGVLRLAGTMAGLVITTALLHFVSPGLFLDVALIALAMFVLRYVGPANYGLCVATLSAMVVLLVALAGVAGQGVVVARALNTAVGGGIALIAYALWSTWERTQVSDVLADMLDAYRRYFHVADLPDLRHRRQLLVAPHSQRVRDAGPFLFRWLWSESVPRESRDRTSRREDAFRHARQFASHRNAALFGIGAARLAAPGRDHASCPVPAQRPVYRGQRHHVARNGTGAEPDRPPRAEFRTFTHDVELTGDSKLEQYALVNTEADRITNSLNTLAEQVLAWTVAATASRSPAS